MPGDVNDGKLRFTVHGLTGRAISLDSLAQSEGDDIVLQRRVPVNEKLFVFPKFPQLVEHITRRVRCEILQHLAIAPCNVSDLAKIMDLSHRTISANLGQLLKCGIVNYDPRGKLHVYRLGACVQAVVDDQNVQLIVRTPQGGEITIKDSRPHRMALGGVTEHQPAPLHVG